MVERLSLTDCITVTEKNGDIRWELSEKCPSKLLKLIRDTAGKGGDTIYAIARPKTDVTTCQIEAEAKCALDVDKEDCVNKEVQACEKNE